MFRTQWEKCLVLQEERRCHFQRGGEDILGDKEDVLAYQITKRGKFEAIIAAQAKAGRPGNAWHIQ